MSNAMKVSIGIVCVSVLVLCTGAVPAGFWNQDKRKLGFFSKGFFKPFRKAFTENASQKEKIRR